MADDSRTSAPTALETPKSGARKPRASAPAVEEELEAADGDDRFSVKGEIARGGMGRVLRAHDRQLGRTVAIKEMLESSKAHERRFEREVEITARLQHPSILPLYDSRRWKSGSPYYVMRLVSGRPLSDAIRECEDLDARLALIPNVLAAADAIAFAHHEGIIHRDIKPSNVLVGEHGETVIIDWGIAKIIGEEEDRLTDDSSQSAPPQEGETMPGAVLGTAGYMAPEQAVGDPVDERTDVYALGATLYQVLAGNAPYGGGDASRLVAKQLSGPPPALAIRAPGTPGDLAAIARKALASAPEDRYRDAGEFAADLRAFTTGRLVEAHDYSLSQRLRRFLGRHRAAVVIALAALLALGAVLTSSVSRIRSERNQALAASAKADRRAQELMVARAATLVPNDPTTAAALLKRLPIDSPVHAKAREVFREARVRGIARKLPGGARHWLKWFPDGRRLVAVHFGELWLHDFDDRGATESRLILDATPRVLAAAIVEGDAIAVSVQDSELVILPVSDGQRRSTQLPGRIKDLVSPEDGRFVVWRTRDGKFGLTKIADLSTVTFDAPFPVKAITVSRDGRWIAGTNDDDRTFLLLDEKPIDVPAELIEPTFDAQSQRIAMTSRESGVVVEFELEGRVLREKNRWTLQFPTSLLLYDGRDILTSQTATGTVYRLFRERVYQIAHTDGLPLIAASKNGLAVLSHEALDIYESSTRTIRFPRSSEGPVRTAFADRFVAIGTLTGELLVYDFSAVMPRKVRVENSLQQFVMTSPTEAWAIESEGWLVKLDLATGKREQITPTMPVAILTVYYDQGTILLNVIDHFIVVRLSDGAAALKRTFRADLAVGVSPGEVLFARENKLYRFNPFEQPEPTLVDTYDAPIHSFAQSGSVTYVATEAGELSRGLGPNRVSTQLPDKITAIPLADDNGVILVSGDKVYRWNGGELELVATLPRPPVLAYPEPNGSVIAIAAGAIYQIRDGVAEAAAMPQLGRGPMVNSKQRLTFGLSKNKRPAFSSFERGHTWLLGPYASLTSSIAAAPDTPVFALVVGSKTIEVYDLRVPTGRGALRMALEEATPARVGDDLESLIWPKRTEARNPRRTSY